MLEQSLAPDWLLVVSAHAQATVFKPFNPTSYPANTNHDCFEQKNNLFRELCLCFKSKNKVFSKYSNHWQTKPRFFFLSNIPIEQFCIVPNRWRVKDNYVWTVAFLNWNMFAGSMMVLDTSRIYQVKKALILSQKFTTSEMIFDKLCIHAYIHEFICCFTWPSSYSSTLPASRQLVGCNRSTLQKSVRGAGSVGI